MEWDVPLGIGWIIKLSGGKKLKIYYKGFIEI